MENNSRINSITLLATIFLIIIGIIFAYLIYSFLLVNGKSEEIEENELGKVEIKTDIFDTIKNPPTYGVTVTAEEPGYGRTNPFASYKAEPVSEEEQAEEQADETESEEQAQSTSIPQP